MTDIEYIFNIKRTEENAPDLDLHDALLKFVYAKVERGEIQLEVNDEEGVYEPIDMSCMELLNLIKKYYERQEEIRIERNKDFNVFF